MKFVDEVKYRDFEFGETLESAEKVGEEIAEVAENESIRKNIRFATNGGKKGIGSLIKDVEKLVKETPWAMFSSEIRKILNVNANTSEDRILQKILSELKVKKITIQRIAETFGYEYTGNFFSLLEKSKGLNPRKIGKEPLLFLNQAQVIRRIILELHAVPKELQPAWFKTLMFLCKEPRSYSFQEIPAEIIGDKSSTKNVKFFPKIFYESAQMSKKKEGLGLKDYRVFLCAKEKFYNEVYLPIKSWLTPEGYKVFEEWKQKYHWGRKL